MFRSLFLLFVTISCVSAQPEMAQALIGKYCQGCHNEKFHSGGVSVEKLHAAAVGGEAATWEQILRKTRTGEMPPLGMPRPDAAGDTAFINWLEHELESNGLAKRNPG